MVASLGRVGNHVLEKRPIKDWITHSHLGPKHVDLRHRHNDNNNFSEESECLCQSEVS